MQSNEEKIQDLFWLIDSDLIKIITTCTQLRESANLIKEDMTDEDKRKALDIIYKYLDDVKHKIKYIDDKYIKICNLINYYPD